MKTDLRKNDLPAVLIFVLGLGVLFAATVVFSHDDDEEKNEAGPMADSLAGTSQTTDSVNALINENYQSVRHIFENSCFDCHSAFTKYPWYYKTPGIKGMIDDDIEEAMGHFDLSNDFPFKSKHDQADILEDIKEKIEEDEMPLMSYRMMHWGKLIEGKQRDSVFQWIDNALKLLRTSHSSDG